MDCAFNTPKAKASSTASEQATVASGTPSRGSRLSEHRYTLTSDSFLSGEVSEMSSVDVFENIQIPFTLANLDSDQYRPLSKQPEGQARHRRSNSHQRRPSISFAAEATYDEVLQELKTAPQDAQCRTGALCLGAYQERQDSAHHKAQQAETKAKQHAHIRTASELDSVVYLGPNESMFSQPKGMSIGDSIEFEHIITRRPQKPPKSSQIADVLRTSMPLLGSMPSSVYCPQCRRETHTQVGYKGNKTFSSVILAALGPFLACCTVPSWLSQLRVHSCVECHQVIGRA
jgi:hypothetical protein